MKSWNRHESPIFKDYKKRDGTPYVKAAMVTNCNITSQNWVIGIPDEASVIKHHPTGMCLDIRDTTDSLDRVGLTPCTPDSMKWVYSSEMKQIAVHNMSGGGFNGQCIDLNRGIGPNIDTWACHPLGHKDLKNQQWNLEERGLIESVSAPGHKCMDIEIAFVNDCGTALWFPHDVDEPSSGDTPQIGRAWAVATFGELRGGNLSLASSEDLVEWRDEGVFLYSRPDKWDNSSLSTGPAPVKLEDGNWLLFYDIDNLWPVQDPKLPFPYYGRCSLGWAILDAKNLTKVLARAEEPLVYAQLPWEVDGFTPLVVYTMGIKSEGNDLFTLYAGGGDRVVEAFSVKVTGSGHGEFNGHYNVM